ncbi:EscU/YscU/HrcU family type III secretion system export apparatus switch protein [Alteraurantiacibacter aquimixticola]|uniref:EscU/YscU/HrcU family type III secretion system export apparatus switch protein n=1 Tax=Alteraurantiacibacter aquimixticola TaxID=2489173 RepID=A0A4T3F943_9SPHN|nr:EscU/YscU/HrcU family type III secretion system export apparatus switch protein [Alteraurantiacibacter aquimixticola]TIX51540.1 EscU/YscU/HrcU family type III secretion system export apparatus switch protein [Alteraurantiacibacter aquimixticola]
MSEQPAGEKSFAPTEKRKKDAAKKGNVLRSKEVATAVAVLAGAMWLKMAGPWLFALVEESAETQLSFDRSTLENFQAGQMMQDILWSILPPLLTLGLLVIAVTMVAQLTFGEGRWVVQNFQPKPSKLNPLTGLKRMFGPQGLIELGKSLAKLVVLGSIAWWWGSANLITVLSLGRGELTGQLVAAWDAIATLLLLLSAGLVLIAMVDWPIQYVRRISQLKMTSQEMRDENKEAEGSPEKKAAIRQRQRDLSKGGMAPAMKEAQFVLTNPTHFSVAMTYDPAVAPAPYVLAKARGERALAMRELAAEYGVPVLEYPVLARAVYFTTRENQLVRAELYAAIASVLAFVMSLKRGERPQRPQVTVPVELCFDAEGQPQNAA